MIHEVPKDLEFFIVIAGRKKRELLTDAISEKGGRILNITYARGAVKSSFIQDILGLVHEEEKVIIACIMPSEKTGQAMEMLTEKFEFDKPNTGIAFTIPLENLTF